MKYLNVALKNEFAKSIADHLSNRKAKERQGESESIKIYEFYAQVNGEKCEMVMTSVNDYLLEYVFKKKYQWLKDGQAYLFDEPIEKRVIKKEHNKKIKTILEREIRGCQGLIIWTHGDRRSEYIGLDIIEVCRAIEPNIQVHCAIYSEMSAPSVKRALEQLTEPDQRKSKAVQVRSEMDFRTGAVFTMPQTVQLKKKLPDEFPLTSKAISYGSCKTPTLGFVAERFKAMEAFVSEPFWKIKVTHAIEDLTVVFDWTRNRVPDKEQCEKYLQLCLVNRKATVEAVTVTSESKWRPTPMNAAELAKLGSCKLKLSVKDIMTIADNLYNKRIISFPRTETNQFSREIDLKSLVEIQVKHPEWGPFARRVIEWGPNSRNGNQVDNVHPPIHPVKLVTDLGGDEARVYELICRHFLACVSKDAEGSQTVVKLDVADEKFTATGLCIKERNYLDVYIYDEWNAKEIHDYKRGQQFDPTEISIQEGATAAPPLLTEVDLIDLMEKHHIGTDNTYADHIDTIKKIGYIGVLNEGFLVPGIIGMCLYEGYGAMGLPLAKPNLRAEFEADLKRICEGEKEPHVVLHEQKEKCKEIYKQMADNISLLDEALKRSFSRFPCLNFPDGENLDNCKEFTIPQEKCRSCNSSDVKVVKFCSASVYYKFLCNATSGWYQTWLHDDGTLRDSINFNLMQSVPSGRVVSDTQDSGVMLGTASGSSDPSSGGFGNMDYNQTATQLTLEKDCRNKGRVFYRCSKRNISEFSQRSDEVSPAANSLMGGGIGTAQKKSGECKDTTLREEICHICRNPVKMIKFCSANNYYKYLSGAPNGWYERQLLMLHFRKKRKC